MVNFSSWFEIAHHTDSHQTETTHNPSFSVEHAIAFDHEWQSINLIDIPVYGCSMAHAMFESWDLINLFGMTG